MTRFAERAVAESPALNHGRGRRGRLVGKEALTMKSKHGKPPQDTANTNCCYRRLLDAADTIAKTRTAVDKNLIDAQ